jgi:hypothetical protein
MTRVRASALCGISCGIKPFLLNPSPPPGEQGTSSTWPEVLASEGAAIYCPSWPTLWRNRAVASTWCCSTCAPAPTTANNAGRSIGSSERAVDASRGPRRRGAGIWPGSRVSSRCGCAHWPGRFRFQAGTSGSCWICLAARSHEATPMKRQAAKMTFIAFGGWLLYLASLPGQSPGGFQRKRSRPVGMAEATRVSQQADKDRSRHAVIHVQGLLFVQILARRYRRCDLRPTKPC